MASPGAPHYFSGWAHGMTGDDPARAARRQVWLLAGAWIFCTALFFLLRPGYTFPLSNHWIDNWIYVGFQWDFRGQLADVGPTYYGARLSAILPGAFLHGCLPPALANIVTKLLSSALLATGCATLVFRAGGFRAAFLAVVLSVACPQVVEMWHNGYVDGPVVVYAVLTLAGVAAARESRWWPAWIFLAGCSFTAMVVANLSSVMAPGMGLAVFALCWLRWKLPRLVAGAGIFVAGGGAMFLLFAGLNVHFGGTFNFIQPQIDAARTISALPKNPWAPVGWEWVTRATWLVLPVGALVWGAGRAWLRPPMDRPVREAVRALTLGLLTSLTMVFLYGLRTGGMGFLGLSYAASLQLALALPLLALICGSFAPDARSPRWVAVTLGALLLVSLGDMPAALAHLPLTVQADRARVLSVTVVAGACAIMAVTRFSPGGWWRKCLRPEPVLVALVIGSTPWYYPHPAARLREIFVAVHSAFQTINASFAPGSFRLWEHPGHSGSRGLASAKLWGYRIFTEKPFPQFDADSVANLADRTLIISAPARMGAQALAEAGQALAPFAEIVRSRIIQVPGEAGTGFDLVTLSLLERTPDPEKIRARVVAGGALLDLNARSSPPYFDLLEINLYGTAPRTGPVVTTQSGVTRFTRTDARDHLATPFRPLVPGGKEARQLAIMVDMPGPSKTFLVVQDETYHTLRTISLPAGRYGHVVAVPSGAKRIRIYFSTASDAPSALPDRVTVDQISSEPAPVVP